jgi:hypothetical protein
MKRKSPSRKSRRVKSLRKSKSKSKSRHNPKIVKAYWVQLYAKKPSSGFGGYVTTRYFTKKEDRDKMVVKAKRIKGRISVSTGIKHKLDLDDLDKNMRGGLKRVYNNNKWSS